MKLDLKAYAEKHPALAAQVPELHARVRATLPSRRPGEAAEEALYASLDVLGISYARQYRWHPTRRWESDAAIPEAKLLLEVDGGVHQAFKDKWERDRERHNAFTSLGWACLRFTPAQALDGTAALEVQRWLAGWKLSHRGKIKAHQLLRSALQDAVDRGEQVIG